MSWQHCTVQTLGSGQLKQMCRAARCPGGCEPAQPRALFVTRQPCWAQQVAMAFSTSATKKAVRLKQFSTSTRGKKKKRKKKSYEGRGCLNPAELQQSLDTTAAQHLPSGRETDGHFPESISANATLETRLFRNPIMQVIGFPHHSSFLSHLSARSNLSVRPKPPTSLISL